MPGLTKLIHAFRRLITQPTGELTRAQRSARFAVDLARHCARELVRNRAPQMAAALTYRTLFSLLPMVILALLLFRAFVGLDEAQDWFQKTAYDFLGWSSVALAPQAGEAVDDADVDADAARDPQEDTDLRASADESLNELVANAWDLDFGSIGMVGLLLLIWAALALLITVEHCFNTIYHCPAGRRWHHRITIYWSVITLGPWLLFISLYVAGQAVQWAQGLPLLGIAVKWFSGFTALGASWLLLFLIYLLMPNAGVRIRSALIGSFVAAALWETGKWGFKLYVTQAVTYSALYGSLGLIPLFLLWLYVTWLIVLFGLQLTYTLQALRGRQFQLEEALKRQEHAADPRWLISMVTLIGKAFAKGQPIDTDELSRTLLISPRTVADMGELLENEGLVHRVEATKQHEGGYSLAVSPRQLRITKLLELGQAMSNGEAKRKHIPGGTMLNTLHEAQYAAAGEATLEEMLEGEGEVIEH